MLTVYRNVKIGKVYKKRDSMVDVDLNLCHANVTVSGTVEY